MFIHRVKIRNYLIHRDTTIDLTPLTVFVGPQGGGKSAFFDAMLNFSMVSRGNLRQAFGPYPYSYRATIHRAAGRMARIGYEVRMSRSIDDEEYLVYEIQYHQTGAADQEPQFTIPHERLVKHPGNVLLFDRRDPDATPATKDLDLQEDRSLLAAIRHAELLSKTVNIDELVLYCARQISRFNRFRLDPGVLAQPSRLPDSTRDPTPRLGYHGEDLSTTLYHLNETQDPSLVYIYERMKAIDPLFEHFEFGTVGTDRIAFAAKYSDHRGAIPSVRLSSGTLNYLGLITLVATPNRPSLLMIEEPENGLTPQAVRSFYQAVRSLAYRQRSDRGSQVLLSSHSPFVICEAWNGEDRKFIHQVKVDNGQALIRDFDQVIREQGIQLRKDNVGDRTILGLTTAEEVMSGYLA
jgi:predicted ATPase